MIPGSEESGGSRWLEGLGSRFLARGGDALPPGLAIRVRLERDASGQLFLRPLPPSAAISSAATAFPFREPPSVDSREAALLLPFLRFFSARFEPAIPERLRRLSRSSESGSGEKALILAAAADKELDLSDAEIEDLSLSVNGHPSRHQSSLSRMNRAPGRDGKRWLMIPVSMADEGVVVEGSIRILLYRSSPEDVVSVKSLVADLRSDRRRWLFQGENPGTAAASLLLSADPPFGADALRIRQALLAALAGIPVAVDVSKDPLEDRFADCRAPGLDFIDEKA